MNRREMVLAGLAAGGDARHTPVQVQKLFFLIDENIARAVRGPHFHFRPYSYGPFDKDVYEELEAAHVDGQVRIVQDGSWRSYALTPDGQRQGAELLAQLDDPSRRYLEEASTFVRGLSFADLVSAIYKTYPDMKANSVFRSPA